MKIGTVVNHVIYGRGVVKEIKNPFIKVDFFNSLQDRMPHAPKDNCLFVGICALTKL